MQRKPSRCWGDAACTGWHSTGWKRASLRASERVCACTCVHACMGMHDLSLSLPPVPTPTPTPNPNSAFGANLQLNHTNAVALLMRGEKEGRAGVLGTGVVGENNPKPAAVEEASLKCLFLSNNTLTEVAW